METKHSAKRRDCPPDIGTGQSPRPKQALRVIEGGLGSPASKLTPAQQSAAVMAANGYSKTRIAAELGVDRVTVYRWANAPEFQAEVNRIWQEQFHSASARLRLLTADAVTGLADIAVNRDHPRQLEAIKFILKAVGLARLPYIGSIDPNLAGSSEDGSADTGKPGTPTDISSSTNREHHEPTEK